ncbi:MAG: maturase, partial [Actinobacteria bacterium]|nr:maturase [Actinomycetota bacterium]
LELSQEKTLITHARTGAAKFLGYEITVQHSNHKTTRGRRAVNGVVRLRVPTSVIKAKCALYLERGKPATQTSLVNRGDFDIVSTYGAAYRGLVQYYLLAGDVYRLNRLHGVMRTSLLKTLACKHDSTGQKMAAKHTAKIETPHGLRTCLQVVVERSSRKPLVARFGGIPLIRQQKAVITDRIPERIIYPRKELPLRLLRGRCEICEQKADVVIHHVRKLADLGQPGPSQPAWAKLMATRRRKTLAACTACHEAIHAETSTATLTA